MARELKGLVIDSAYRFRGGIKNAPGFLGWARVTPAAPPPPPPPPPPTGIPVIGAVSSSDYTTTEGTTVDISWTNSGGLPTLTLLDVNGDGTPDYTLTTETSQSHAYPSAGTFAPTVTLSNASGSDSDSSPSIVVSVGGADSLITILTTTENGTGGAKTNEIVEIGLPLHPSALTGGQGVKVVDDDGSGGVGAPLANFQWDLEAHDDSSAIRYGKITAILPALGSGASRKLRAYASSDPLPTGTAITIADIQALPGYANGLVAFKPDIGGTVHSLSLKDLFDGGSTTFSKTGLNIAADLIRSGPVCTEWRVFGPVRSGGSPHNAGNGVWAEYHVSAYKAGVGAVSGGNPITHVRVDVVRKNGAIDRAIGDVSHYYYGSLIERPTSLSDPTMISTDYTDPVWGKQRYNYPRTQPAATITLEGKHVGVFLRVAAFDTQTTNFTVGQVLTGSISGVLGKIVQIYDTGTSGVLTLAETDEPFAPTVGEILTDPLGGSATFISNFAGNWPYQNTAAYGARYLTIVRDSGVWPTDVLGSILTADSGGKAVVGDRVSDTTLRVWIFEAFSGYTYTSGNWRLEGVGHYYNTRHVDRVRIGTPPSNVTLWGDHTVSAGSAVDPKTRAAMDYLDSTHMTPPYAASWATAAHSMTGEDAMKGDGAIRPGTVRGPSGGHPNSVGGIYQYIGGTGARHDIGTLPVWQVGAIIRPDANGLRKLIENARHYMTYHHSLGEIHTNTPATGVKGLCPRSDNGLAYKDTTAVNIPDNWNTAGSGVPGLWDTDVAHHPAGPFLEYLWTGDYIWLQELQAYAAHTEWASCTGYQGTGHQKTPYGHATAAETGGGSVFPVGQTRAAGWRLRDRLVSAAATPAASKPSLYHPKSYERARITMNMEAANSARGILAPQFSGNDAHWLQSYRFGTLASGIQINLDALWQLTYNAQSIAFLDYLGFGDANSDAFMAWLASDVITNPNADVVEDLWTKMYFMCYEVYPTTGLASSRAEAYKWSCHVGPINGNGWGFTRPGNGITISGTLTLSDSTVGSGRTFTFSSALFSGGGTGTGAWYVGGYIRSSAGGLARITSVVSSTVVECEILTAFSSTTPTFSNIIIPGPHPSDYSGQAAALDGSSTTQIQDFVNVARVLPRWGYDKSSLIAAQIARANYNENRLNFHLKVRT